MNYRAILLATFVLGAASLGANSSANPAPPAQSSELKPIVPGEKSGFRVTSFAPLAYFNQNCARCHGENGSFYSDDMGKDKDDEALRHIIDEMANGPGQAPLAPADLEVVTAWHRALRDKKTVRCARQSRKNRRQLAIERRNFARRDAANRRRNRRNREHPLDAPSQRASGANGEIARPKRRTRHRVGAKRRRLCTVNRKR